MSKLMKLVVIGIVTLGAHCAWSDRLAWVEITDSAGNTQKKSKYVRDSGKIASMWLFLQIIRSLDYGTMDAYGPDYA